MGNTDDLDALTGSDALADCIDCISGKYVGVTGSDELSDCIDCTEGKLQGSGY